MALRRRTRVFRTVGWLVCQVIEMPNIDDVDQAALDTHISRHSPSATRGTRVRARAGTLTPRRGLNLRLACGSPPVWAKFLLTMRQQPSMRASVRKVTKDSVPQNPSSTTVPLAGASNAVPSPI
jgi:hypothetical protein